jgi:broad specificity phosphatase PhoE
MVAARIYPSDTLALRARVTAPSMQTSTYMATTLYLVRHGETMGNRIRRYQPHDMPLTDEGRAQARLVAVRLAEEGPFDAIYASDMARTLETAAAIGSCLGLTPVPDARLRELDTGDWKGIPYTEIDERFPGHRERWIAAGGIERMPGPEGESTTDVHARMTEAFEEYVAAAGGDTRYGLYGGVPRAALPVRKYVGDDCRSRRGRRPTLPAAELHTSPRGCGGQ